MIVIIKGRRGLIHEMVLDILRLQKLPMFNKENRAIWAIAHSSTLECDKVAIWALVAESRSQFLERYHSAVKQDPVKALKETAAINDDYALLAFRSSVTKGMANGCGSNQDSTRNVS